MLNDFIRQTVEFLKHSDIHIDSPSIESIEFNVDGTCGRTCSCWTCTGAAEIKENVILNVTILFSLLDVLVDRRFPHLEGKSLRKKYLSLPSYNDHQIMFKEIYRIMKVFRNAIVHSKTSVSKNSNGFSIDYEYNSSHYKLTIERRALGLIFSMIIHYTRLVDSPYITGILRTYYDQVLSGIAVLLDDINSPLAPISDALRLKVRRYRTKDRAYRFDERANALLISRYEFDGPEQGTAHLDYYVTVDGQLYLIPDEALDSSGAIARADMEEWVYDQDRFFV